MRVKRNVVGAVSAAAMLVIAGCAGKPEPAAPTSTFVLPSVAASLTPAVYMSLASTSSLFAIKASELALARSTSGSTRSAAQAIIVDQGGVGSQLSYAGRRLDLLPSAALTDAQAADLERLRQSVNFDSDYRKLVGDTLAHAWEAHRNFAASGSSPTLRPVAQMAAPVTKKDVDALRR
jgi:putative membrane protein